MKKTDLTSNRNRKVTNLNDPTKNKILDIETKKMIHYVSSSINIDCGKRYRCWWCTLSIEHEPIGCPLNILPSKSKDGQTYSTDGVFCSFNCVKAYIDEKEKTDATYKLSHILLANMYCDMNKCVAPITIKAAPDKRLLNLYGGFMTEDQYRHCFDRLLYTEKGIIKMFPITTIFQEEENLHRCPSSKRL